MKYIDHMAEQNKLMKTVTDFAVLVGLAAGFGYVSNKMLKENFLGDPSTNVMNYCKWTVVGSYLAKYFSGDDSLAEKKRHHIALEKYQKDYAKYQENREKLLDWQEQNRENNE